MRAGRRAGDCDAAVGARTARRRLSDASVPPRSVLASQSPAPRRPKQRPRSTLAALAKLASHVGRAAARAALAPARSSTRSRRHGLVRLRESSRRARSVRRDETMARGAWPLDAVRGARSRAAHDGAGRGVPTMLDELPRPIVRDRRPAARRHRAAARRSSTCASRRTSSPPAAACSCWCRRSRSRRPLTGCSARGSAIARGDPAQRALGRASGTISGTASAAATSTSSSARARPCSRRSSSSASSSSTRSTTASYKQDELAAVSRTRRRGRARTDGAGARRARIGDAVARVGGERRRPAGTISCGSPQRVLNRPLAAVQVVDMRKEYAAARRGRHVQRAAARQRSTIAWRRREQSRRAAQPARIRDGDLLPAVRRVDGVPALQRRASRFTARRRRVRCHYCNYSARGAAARAAPAAASTSSSRASAPSGSRRISRAAFPGARIARVDRDTIRRRGAIARVLRDVAAGDIDILVGTQMIAKGHDFPAVTLVGVVSADVGLGLADFRAAERTFQLLTQVVGRAGRGDKAGEAIIQTLYPDHYSVRAAAAQDYDAFFAREMEFRKSSHYPPAVPSSTSSSKAGTLDAAMTRRRRSGRPRPRVTRRPRCSARRPPPWRRSRTSSARSSSSKAAAAATCVKASSPPSPPVPT